MAKRRRKTLSQAIVLWTLVAAVFVGTLFALFALAPEEARLVSADGRVRLEGRIPDPDRMRVFLRTDYAGPFTAVRSPVYEIDFGSEVLPEPFLLTVTYEADWADDASDLRIFFWNTDLGAWQALPSVVDSEAMAVQAEILAPAELWGVGTDPSALDRPREYASLLNELVSFPPPGAVGYHAGVATTVEPGDFVVLRDGFARGGCDGEFQRGTDRTVTSQEREADGVTYRVFVEWEIADGCSQDAPLL